MLSKILVMYRTGWRRPDGLVVFGAISLVIGLAAAGLATRFSTGGAVDVAVHPITMAVILIAVCFPLVWWAVDGDKTLFRIVLAGLAAKAVGTFLRFTLTGSGDNRAYHMAATNIAGWLSDAIVGPSGLPAQFGGDGSGRLAYGLGWLYYLMGADRLTGFVMFAFIGFVGTLLFFRASISAVPELDQKRFALLLFFMPSMLFWPSTIGKEAWMLGFLGLASLGISVLTAHRITVSALVALVLGLVMAAQIRPHVAALVIVALAAAVAWPSRASSSRLRQIVIVIVALGFLTIAMSQVATYFGAEEGEVTDVLDFAQARTDTGGSAFAPVRVTGPQNFVPGAASVMFRPYLHEAGSVLQLVGALESTALIGLIIFSFQRVRQVPRLFLENGYVRFAVFYTIGFVVAFSVISNFGILARQRSQLWPVVLLLLALAPKSTTTKKTPRVDNDTSTAIDADVAPDHWA